MTEQEAINAYKEKFGSFPYFLTMGISETDLIALIKNSLSSGEEIKPERDDLIY